MLPKYRLLTKECPSQHQHWPKHFSAAQQQFGKVDTSICKVKHMSRSGFCVLWSKSRNLWLSGPCKVQRELKAFRLLVQHESETPKTGNYLSHMSYFKDLNTRMGSFQSICFSVVRVGTEVLIFFFFSSNRHLKLIQHLKFLSRNTKVSQEHLHYWNSILPIKAVIYRMPTVVLFQQYLGTYRYQL